MNRAGCRSGGMQARRMGIASVAALVLDHVQISGTATPRVRMDPGIETLPERDAAAAVVCWSCARKRACAKRYHGRAALRAFLLDDDHDDEGEKGSRSL